MLLNLLRSFAPHNQQVSHHDLHEVPIHSRKRLCKVARLCTMPSGCTAPSAQEALQGRRDQRSPRSLSGSGRYGPARVPGLSSPITGSILPAWLGGIATYHRCALPSLLRTTPPQPVTSAGPTGTRTCEFHHESLCSVAHSYRVDS